MIKITTLLVSAAIPFISSASDIHLDYLVNKQQIIVEDHFIGSNEPKVIDALWTDDTSFKVAVADDGTNQNGFAQYVCKYLYKKGFQDKAFQVDVVSIDQPFLNGNWESIGTAKCSEHL